MESMKLVLETEIDNQEFSFLIKLKIFGAFLSLLFEDFRCLSSLVKRTRNQPHFQGFETNPILTFSGNLISGTKDRMELLLADRRLSKHYHPRRDSAMLKGK